MSPPGASPTGGKIFFFWFCNPGAKTNRRQTAKGQSNLGDSYSFFSVKKRFLLRVHDFSLFSLSNHRFGVCGAERSVLSKQSTKSQTEERILWARSSAFRSTSFFLVSLLHSNRILRGVKGARSCPLSPSLARVFNQQGFFLTPRTVDERNEVGGDFFG